MWMLDRKGCWMRLAEYWMAELSTVATCMSSGNVRMSGLAEPVGCCEMASAAL